MGSLENLVPPQLVRVKGEEKIPLFEISKKAFLSLGHLINLGLGKGARKLVRRRLLPTFLDSCKDLV